MEKRYEAVIEDIDFIISLSEDEICTFVTHFGKFGNITITDKHSGEIVVNTVGIHLNC